MKISIVEGQEFGETEIVIRCRKADPQILKLAASLSAFDKKVTGHKDQQTFLLDEGEILYIESVDKRTFLYTEDGVYETPMRLYELEERLRAKSFFRASKSAVVNFDKIRSLQPDLGGRMRLTMANGEMVFVSRQYVSYIKEKLGIKPAREEKP